MHKFLKDFVNALEKQKALVKSADDTQPQTNQKFDDAKLARNLIVDLIRHTDLNTQKAFAKSVRGNASDFQQQSAVSSSGLPDEFSGLRVRHISSLGAFLQYLSANKIEVDGERVAFTENQLNAEIPDQEKRTEFVTDPNILLMTEWTPDASKQDLPEDVNTNETTKNVV